MNFNGLCLIKNNISSHKKVIRNLNRKKKFKHRFYINKMLVWICKANL